MTATPMSAPGWIIGLLLAVLGTTADAAPPPGGQLIDRVEKAYRDTDHYDATLKLQIAQTSGRWTQTQSGEIYVALDRAGNRLLIDAPDQTLVADGKTLFYRTGRYANKHLQIDAVNPLTCEWIVEQAPGLTYPATPTDLAFLLATNPIAFVSRGAAGAPATLPADPNDPLKRPRVEVALQTGTMTLTIDPATYLIDKVIVDVDEAQLNLAFGTVMQYTFEIEVHNREQPVADDRFVFDTTGSAPSDSMQHMMASGANRPHQLTDHPAPPLNLPDLDGMDHDIAIDDEDAEVIVLQFWATWCPPCAISLPDLQELYDWAQAGGKPVAVYAINQGETVEEVKQYFSEGGLSVPVLMDENFAATESFGVQAVPHVVIIADGRVRYVVEAYDEQSGGHIREQVEALLQE